MDKKYRGDFGDIEHIIFPDEPQCASSCDVMIAIGGDGTILKCAGIAMEWGKPILGINCGRLGFMASLEHDQLHMLSQLCSGNYSVSRRMMLNIRVISADKETDRCALNDVVISKTQDCKIADFEVSKSGQMISSLRADGVIFSTATGSTAYSMSAGGPIIEPQMECIEFTQICPHSLFARSMILFPDLPIQVKCHCSSGKALVNIDGNLFGEVSQNDKVLIGRSEKYIEIIDITGGSFFNSVNEKLMQPLKDIPEGIIK